MKCVVVLLLCLGLLWGWGVAQQKDTVEVNGFYESSGVEGTLNDAIESAKTQGKLSTTVFKLHYYEQYVLTGTIEVPEGEVLEIVAPKPGTTQETAPPQILWTTSGSVNKDIMFDCYGDLTMKNVWIRFADISGTQSNGNIRFEDSELANNSGKGEIGIFEGCIFDGIGCPPGGSGAVCVMAKHFKGYFTNCYFRNCVDYHYMYYGRALSFPYDVSGWHTDYVLFENCTFANMGYVYMQERDCYGDNVHFNHCTFYNVVMFSLEGGVYYRANITNSLFINAYMLGFRPIDGEDPSGAIISITQRDSIQFGVPFNTDKDRHILIAHNAYYIEDWLADWMRGGWEINYSGTKWRPDPRISTVGSDYSKAKYKSRYFNEIPVPRPMLDSWTITYCDSVYDDGTGNLVKTYPYINRARNYDIYNLKISGQTDTLNPGLIEPPINLGPLKWFINQKWSDNLDTNWSYRPDVAQNQIWPLPENLAYTNAILKTAAMGNYPLGDLYHWWPEEYASWLAQADNEREKIAYWLETGIHPDSVVGIHETREAVATNFVLHQNYPNPFNPTTTISFSVPYKAPVSLTIYNTLGQEVAKLVDEVKPAGTHQVTFDTQNLPGGIYLYVLRSAEVSIAKKLALIK